MTRSEARRIASQRGEPQPEFVEKREHDLSENIEGRLLALAEKARAQLSEHSWCGDTDEGGNRVGYECEHDGPCHYEGLLDAMGGDQDPAKNRFADIVAALCQVVEAGRLLTWSMGYSYQRNLPKHRADFDAALAALDEIGRTKT